MTSSEHVFPTSHVFPNSRNDGREDKADTSETIPSHPSRAYLEVARKEWEGMDESAASNTSCLPNRTRDGKRSPHVLLTVSDAAELLRIVTQSRPINHDQTELVADLAAIVRRARAIETRTQP